MTKKELQWDLEYRLRAAIAYSGYRHSFFVKLNVILCIVALASLWLSGYSASGGGECLSFVLNVIGSLSLALDVALNVKGLTGFWESMFDGYNSLFSEFVRVREKASAEELSDLRFRLQKFDGRCKSTLNALLLIARNVTCDQLGVPQYKNHIPWYKSLTSNFISW